jgi:HEAT repeat protein
LMDSGANEAIALMKCINEIGPSYEPRNRELRIRLLTSYYFINKEKDSSIIQSLLGSLKDNSGDVRHRALVGLKKMIIQGEIANPGFVREIIEAISNSLLKDEWSFVRELAADVFGQIGDTHAIEMLNFALKDNDPLVRAVAEYGIAKAKVSMFSLPALADIEKLRSAHNVEGIIRVLLNSDELLRLRLDAIQALIGFCEPRVIQSLKVVLKDKDCLVRKQAILALERFRDPCAIDALIEATEDCDNRIKADAVWAMYETVQANQLVDPKITDCLLKMLKDHYAAMSASAALGMIGDPRAVDDLIAALKNPRYVSSPAIEALGKIGGSRAVDELIDFLRDSKYRDGLIPMWGSESDDPKSVKDIERAHERGFFLREAAAIALGKIGDKKAIEVLLEALNDHYCFVCEASAKALGRIADERSIDALIEALKYPLPNQEKYSQWQRVRANAAEALGKIGDHRALNGLIEALKDEDDNVRFQASNSLHKIDGDRFPLPPPYENSELKTKEQHKFLCYELRKKGERAYSLCQYEKALNYFEEALEYDPNNGDAYYQRAETLQRLNRNAESDLWLKISYFMRKQDSLLVLTKEMRKD